MPRVVHFEMAADDPNRAVGFYRGVFGWKIEKWEGPEEYWLCMTGEEGEPGIDGAIMERSDPRESTLNTIQVPSLDEFMAKVIDLGGKVLRAEMEIPGVGRFAYCQDTEGNFFGLLEPVHG